MNAIRDQQRRAYLYRVFELMRGPRRHDITAKALSVIDLWDAQPGVRGAYSRQWRGLLEGDLDSMRRTVLADTPEAAELRHSMPFAGILSNKERADLRAYARSAQSG